MRPRALVLLLLISGCSSLYNYDGDSYVVRSGDTLYSIAFRYGIDARELARWNGIANPDRIYVGQRLRLGPAGAGASAPPSSRAPAAEAARPSAQPASQPAPRTAPADAVTAWSWPVTGPIVGRFGDRRVLSTGIGIGGTLGQAIAAAAPGRVVYAGSGLPDYGQLVIIEHAAGWLSAYGHVRRMLVSQGDRVRAGDKIAEMGTGPGGVAMLHFEIRRNGDPLDPLSVLPPPR
jgi:lipoprotein NlpD